LNAVSGFRRHRWLWLAALVVLGLIALPFALAVPDLPAATLKAKYASPASQFLTVEPGLTVHVRDEGVRNGLPVVLVHGSSASLQTWEPWVRLLGTHYRIISLDLPGHGLTGPSPTHDYSMAGNARVVHEVAARLGVDHFVIAGNSMGGAVAWTYAATNPEQVVGLILVDSAGAPREAGAKMPIGFKIAGLPVVRDIARYITPRSMVEKSIRQTVAVQSVVTPAMIDRYWDLLRYPGNRDATIERFSTPHPPADPAVLEKINAPTLILWGASDKLIPVASAAWFSQHLPHARVIVYDGVGHAPMEEAPDRTAADVATFLASLGRG
jgi:pimeloyl-ACP methyl ester carboxylesterase